MPPSARVAGLAVVVVGRRWMGRKVHNAFDYPAEAPAEVVRRVGQQAGGELLHAAADGQHFLSLQWLQCHGLRDHALLLARVNGWGAIHPCIGRSARASMQVVETKGRRGDVPSRE